MNEDARNQRYLEIVRNMQANIKVLKKFRGYTNKDLARITGYSLSYIGQLSSRRIEDGRPSLEFVVKMADALGTTPGKLLDERPPLTQEEYAKQRLLAQEEQ